MRSAIGTEDENHVSDSPHTKPVATRRLTAGAIVASLAILFVASLPWDGASVRESPCWVLPNGHTVQITGTGECPLGAEERLTAVVLDGRRVALQGTETLERAFRRVESELSVEVLQLAVQRHPTASWVVELSRKIEGQSAGITHLMASAAHPSFAQNCWAHAAAGHLPGLIEIAKRTGRAEPAAALTSSGHLDAAAIAMVAALEKMPNAPVVAMIAAAWGPCPESILHRTLPHLRSKKVACSLFQQSTGYPAFSNLLDTIIRAMVHS